MTMVRMLLPALFALAACSPAVSDAQSGTQSGPSQASAKAAQVHAESGLRVIPVTVTTAEATYTFRTELAESRMEQAKGLMFRTELGENEGMLFPMKPVRQASFWMKNTVIPLDIIFIGEDRSILNIAANTVPYSEEQLTSDGVAIAVLELAGGRAAQLGIERGDAVEW